MKKLVFIAGLPRSGSTLLGAILNQDPRVSAGMTSPVNSMFSALIAMMSQNKEIKALVDDAVRERVLRGVFDSYYSDRPEREIVFDTNRGWTARIHQLFELFSDVKLVVCVRDPAWIFDSFERITRQPSLRQSSMVKPGSTIESRSDQLMGPDGFIGGPLANLKEAVYGPNSECLLLVDYTALCQQPDQVLRAVYRFIDEPAYEHDFSNVSYKQEVFDEALNTPGLHTVDGAVTLRPRRTILPPEIFSKLSSRAFWMHNLPDNLARVVSVPGESGLRTN